MSKKESVRRQLFPESDGDSLTKNTSSTNYLNEEKSKFKIKYNFDFVNETPLNGRFKYTNIKAQNKNELPSTIVNVPK